MEVRNRNTTNEKKRSTTENINGFPKDMFSASKYVVNPKWRLIRR